jgi:hypothetical protein
MTSSCLQSRCGGLLERLAATPPFWIFRHRPVFGCGSAAVVVGVSIILESSLPLSLSLVEQLSLLLELSSSACVSH